MRQRDRVRAGLTATLLVAAFLGCGSNGPVDAAEPSTELEISVRARQEAPADRYVLRCDPPGGSHPNPVEACAVARRVSASAFAPVPPNVACTQIFGGTQLAHVEGVIEGVPVDADLARHNGCEIARWDRVRPLVPLPVSAAS